MPEPGSGPPSVAGLSGGPAGTSRADPARSSGVSRRGEWDVAVVIGVGGALGGAARYGVNLFWPVRVGAFPWATVVENVSGCLLIGALMVYVLEVLTVTRYARPFLGVGVLGGFTTFSAYTADTAGLLRAHQPVTATGYFLGTVLVALAATWVGLTVTRAFAGHRARAGTGRGST